MPSINSSGPVSLIYDSFFFPNAIENIFGGRTDITDFNNPAWGAEAKSLAPYRNGLSSFGTTGPIDMDSFRGSSGEAIEIYSSGQLTSSTSWTNYSIALGAKHLAGDWKIAVRYQNGVSSTRYRGDFQLEHVYLKNGGTYLLQETFETAPNPQWQTTVNSSSTNGSATYPSTSFVTMPSSSTSTYRWNRDSAGTGSSGTGLTAQGWCLYVETSGSNTLGDYYWLSCPTVFNSTAYTTWEARVGKYGSNIGNFNVYMIPPGLH